MDPQEYECLIRNTFKQLAKGLSKLHHEQDLCLLNLSLNKVLLDSEFVPKYFDFSCAKDTSESVLTLSELHDLLKDKMHDQSLRVYLAPEAVS